MRVRLAILLLAMLSSSGCSLLKSRYAMDDPVYAEKYADGAPKSDLLGKAKQALDARHTAGLKGIYFSGGAQVRPHGDDALIGVEAGLERYATNWLTYRGSLAGYGGAGDSYAVLELGVRFQAPWRIAPFAGVGAFTGDSHDDVDASHDGIDNDDDIFIDEPGEEKTIVDGWLSGVYPEVGVHFWLNGHLRATAYGRYLITTEGRAQDDWLLGGQLTLFGR